MSDNCVTPPADWRIARTMEPFGASGLSEFLPVNSWFAGSLSKQ